MKKLYYILITAIILSSCSPYQKVLKAEDIAPKFKMGEALYNEGKYAKANRLFAQIVPSYRGKPQAEKLMYLYADSYYQMQDYYVSGYQLERFVTSYPKSEKLEEASFHSAKSYYMLSPVYSKDQTETLEAIDKLQSFINLNPESKYISEANELVKELGFKLEKKAYEIAKQYNLISDYQASIRAFDNFIFEYPGSELREDAFFYRYDSAYQLAINSVERKKINRLNKAKEYYNTFKKSFVNSKHVEIADNMVIELDKELENYNAKNLIN